jgi:hypothetical protein
MNGFFILVDRDQDGLIYIQKFYILDGCLRLF